MATNIVSTPGYTFAASGAQAGAKSPLYPFHDPIVAKALIVIAQALVNPRGKGIYATDETPEGIAARLAAAEGPGAKEYNEEEKRERRRKWRECLYESLSTGISCRSISMTFSDTYEFRLP